ncbi:MAG TPA: ATPase, T2SS/T4P/T4SS family [Mycobacteriales bacterium]|nr:ATPase, T2SS/T4P/T4SS family [Mycobacteriales bacterium]
MSVQDDSEQELDPPGERRRSGRQRWRIGEVLIESGVLTETQLADSLAVQEAQPAGSRQRLGEILVRRGLVSERDIGLGLARVLGLPLVDLTNSTVAPGAARLLPRTVSERYGVLATDLTGDHLTLAMSDPTDVVALDDVRLYSQVRSIKVIVATPTAIRTQLNRIWSLGENAPDVAAFDEIEGDVLREEDDDLTTAGLDDAPVVRLINQILADATRAFASDIHLEPERAGLRIRYRVDGLLRDVMAVPRGARSALTSRIKIISGLDIAERRRPQDGRTRLEVDGTQVDARVSTMPTMHGEKVVIRLLTRTEGVVPLGRIGLSDRHLEIFLETVVEPQGLILVTGPTGSGKTSTLYSAVTQLRTPDRNLVSLEDPVEMQLTGVNQMQVHEKAGVTFARGLRAILRQDPDVILVGEIRDQETAELALRASLTGHVVFSTLHTNDAASAVTRLVDMGVEPFLISSSLTLVVAQRLVREPCSGCAAPYTPSPRTLEQLGMVAQDIEGHELLRGTGCELCGQTGYRGRQAIFEVMPIDARLRAVLTASPTETSIRSAARSAGCQSLRADGIAKAMRGLTTLEEVIRVTQVDAVAVTRCQGCYRVLDDGMIYCPWCATAVDENTCRSCAARLEADWRHCPWCRSEVVDPLRPAGPDSSMPLEGAHRPRVVIVDDDASVRAFAMAALVDVADVIEAATAQEGLRICAVEKVDAAIIDLQLPDLSGIEIIRLLRADASTTLLPLLLMTGSSDMAMLDEARRAGVDDVVAKPVDALELEARVNSLLSATSLKS